MGQAHNKARRARNRLRNVRHCVITTTSTGYENMDAFAQVVPAAAAVANNTCSQETPARRFGVNFAPGRYFTFSCSVLMISVSLRSPTFSSNTHICSTGGGGKGWADEHNDDISPQIQNRMAVKTVHGPATAPPPHSRTLTDS